MRVTPGLMPPICLRRSARFAAEDAYVFDVTGNRSSLIASGSTGEIKLYDPGSLEVGRTLSYHRKTITRVQAHADAFVLSSSKDGTVACWDLRQASEDGPAMVFRAKHREPLLSFDLNCMETILAAGTELVGEDAKIIFWDVRNASQAVAEFAEMHSDDVTQVQFHPTEEWRLLTGSVDGLVCNLDVRSFDEDEAATAVINSESSIHKAGYFGPLSEYVYCLTHNETFSLWRAADAEILCNYGDIRQTRESSPDLLTVNYAVDCVYAANVQRLFLLVGSSSGDIGIVHVAANDLQLCQVLKGGHTEIVRGIFWNPENNLLASGGEDSKVCVWG